MSGWAIVVLVLGVFAFSMAFSCFELWLNKKQREEQKKNDEEFSHMMTIFDEMGYAPTTFCEEPDKEAQEFKKRLIEIYNKKA